MAGPTFAGNQLKNSNGTITITSGTGNQAITQTASASAISSAIAGLSSVYAPLTATPVIIASNQLNGATGGVGGLINESLHPILHTGNYELCVRLTVNSATGGTVSLTFTYADDAGTTQTVPLATLIGTVGVYLIPSSLIGMTQSGGGTFSLNSSVVGTINYDFGGTLTYIPAI